MHKHLLLCLLVVGAGLLATPAAAHESETIEGYELTFGGADEPVITDERMWLQLSIENASGAPVPEQADTLAWRVERIERGMNATPLEVSEAHRTPGLYEAAVVFTKPGDYRVHVNGTIESTHVHTHFEKTVIDRSSLAYPNQSESDMDQPAGNSSMDEGDTGENSPMPGFGVAIALLTLAGVGLALRRRV